MNFVIVGCGLIGQKRAKALRAAGHSVRLAVDSVADRAEALLPAALHVGCQLDGSLEGKGIA